MCISPDEMTTAELENEIAGLYRWADTKEKAGRHDAADRWRTRAKALEALLKERAEKGTI